MSATSRCPASGSTPDSTTRAVLVAAEEQADVILWDGAGNDLPFLRPRLHIMLTDPLRGGEEAGVLPRRGGRCGWRTW